MKKEKEKEKKKVLKVPGHLLVFERPYCVTCDLCRGTSSVYYFMFFRVTFLRVLGFGLVWADLFSGMKGHYHLMGFLEKCPIWVS